MGSIVCLYQPQWALVIFLHGVMQMTWMYLCQPTYDVRPQPSMLLVLSRCKFHGWLKSITSMLVSPNFVHEDWCFSSEKPVFWVILSLIISCYLQATSLELTSHLLASCVNLYYWMMEILLLTTSQPYISTRFWYPSLLFHFELNTTIRRKLITTTVYVLFEIMFKFNCYLIALEDDIDCLIILLYYSCI